MKKILLAAITIALVASCSSKKEEGYTIKGFITGATNGKAVIINNVQPRSAQDLISDTTEIVAGNFTFTGKATTPEYYALIIDGKIFRFFLDNSDITITGSIDSIDHWVVKGSKVFDDIQAMNEKRKQLNDEFNAKYHLEEMMKEYQLPTTTEARKEEIKKRYEELEPEMDKLYDAENAIETDYIKNNPTSPYVPMIVLSKAKYDGYTAAELVPLIKNMETVPAFAENRFVKELKELTDILQKTDVGQKAPDFTQNDPNGNPISLSEVYAKNKITMIDFWASWCGPCRRFNPTLVKIYEKYHDKGFEIFATSFDGPRADKGEIDETQAHERWVKAIKDDNLTWVHVSDLQYWNNAAGKLYYIRSIPSNIFVDQNGIILAKKLSEKEIETLLDENLK